MKHAREEYVRLEKCIYRRVRDGVICTYMIETGPDQFPRPHSNISEARAWRSQVEAGRHTGQPLEYRSRYEFSELVPIFLGLKDVTDSSRAAYQRHFDRLFRFLGGRRIRYVHEFTKQIRNHLVLYLKSPAAVLDGTPTRGACLSPNTQRAHLISYNDFFNWAFENDYIHDTPFRGFQLKRHLKRPKADPDFYRPDEIEAFFRATRSEAHRRIFRTLYWTGLRASELANLEWEDLDMTAPSGPVLHVVARPDAPLKSESSQRDIPVAGELEVLLRNIIENPLSPDRPFCTDGGGKLTRRTMYEICTRIGKRAGITSQVTIHKWRHSFSSKCIQNRIPVSQLQQLLGHADITTTMIYAHDNHPTESETREALAQVFAEED
jgi:integrase/recombinase XerD